MCEVMLAETWTPDVDPSGWHMSEKLDGVRAVWDGEHLRTRKGNLIPAPVVFLAKLPKGIPLDGELWLGRGRFEETVSMLNTGVKDPRWAQIRFMIFDIPESKFSFEDHLKLLPEIEKRFPGVIEAVKYMTCPSREYLLTALDFFLKNGAEGLMLRRPGSRYEKRRSPALLKVKKTREEEATVIAHQAGEGGCTGLLGALVVKRSDGLVFKIGTGFTERDRAKPAPIGSIVTYTFTDTTKGGKPKYASFKAIRNYE